MCQLCFNIFESNLTINFSIFLFWPLTKNLLLGVELLKMVVSFEKEPWQRLIQISIPKVKSSKFNSKSQFFKIFNSKICMDRLSKSPSQNWLFCFKFLTRSLKYWSKIALLMDIWLVSVFKLQNCWFCWFFHKNI